MPTGLTNSPLVYKMGKVSFLERRGGVLENCKAVRTERIKINHKRTFKTRVLKWCEDLHIIRTQ